jgi:dCTP deaminase
MPDDLAPELFPGFGPAPARRRRGVLPFQDIRRLVETAAVTVAAPTSQAIEPSQLQPASIDLRLGDVAYQVRASFLPGTRKTVLEAMTGLEVQRLDLANGFVLQRGAVYIIPLQECLALPADLIAKANPKSTTGRLDIFARLISDHASQFDLVTRGYRGPLYVELAPTTFNVRVRPGTRINQLKFVRGLPPVSDSSRKAAGGRDILVYDRDGNPQRATVASGLWFSVDLEGPPGGETVGWKAVRDAPVIDVDAVAEYEPRDFWEPIGRPAGGRLILNPGDFYILGSRERVRVPVTYAAEMVPYDPSMGEFRVHSAGFFDPGFGYGAGELHGTRAILEVRTHDVPYALQDGQPVGRLVYERLLAPTQLPYGERGSSYQHQSLGLGKQFKQQR